MVFNAAVIPNKSKANFHLRLMLTLLGEYGIFASFNCDRSRVGFDADKMKQKYLILLSPRQLNSCRFNIII